MPTIFRFALKFIFSALITLFITTTLLYATVMLTPAETRASLYMPKNLSPRVTEEQMQKMIDNIIERYHLNAPFPVQYYYWVSNLVKGVWGFSPTLNEDVFNAIVRRASATGELTLYSILFFMPLGLLSGLLAGKNQNKLADHSFRLTAFIATSLPPFILAIVMMAIFYANLNWFQPERIGSGVSSLINSDQFRHFTGLLTVDGLFNGRLDVTIDALRHLFMPAFTLALAHWATLGRITRATVIEELQQDYIVAARARGIPERRILWRHVLQNAVSPALTSSLLSAASLLTGVFVVEIIFNFHGISYIIVRSMQYVPDAPAALGFAIYNVIVVLIFMGILDLLKFILDPRVREEA